MTGTCAPPSGRVPFSFGCDPWTLTYVVVPIVALTPLLTLLLLPLSIKGVGKACGWYLRKKTEGRRLQLLEIKEEDERAFQRKSLDSKGNTDGHWEKVGPRTTASSGNDDKGAENWAGIVGFFHPFCNAGGGGERVLWAAIRATQQRWPKALCVVYTGDHDVNKQAILARVKNRFNIELHPPTVVFLYLSTRHLVLASTWPRFTLMGQSLGSMVMAWDAFQLCVPDIFIDTMGYAFALGTCRLLFRDVPTCAYVHYPTISTDMLESLDPTSAVGDQGVNAGKGVGTRGKAKKLYWQIFAKIYSWMGSTVRVVMTNSSWTQGHIEKLWGPYRTKMDPVTVVYPPCAVHELEQEVEVSVASEKKRERVILYIAQFRPEKNHPLIVQSFAEFLKSNSPAAQGSRLVLVGSVRDGHDAKRVYKLRLLAHELGITESVEFHIDASWPEILNWLRKSSVGANGMWNEHFGIGVVEYQAAGLISVVHDSGGPKVDIVVNVDGEPTGFHATNTTEFAQGFEQALSLPNPLAVRERARRSARRFTEEEFAKKWIVQMEKLVAMRP